MAGAGDWWLVAGGLFWVADGWWLVLVAGAGAGYWVPGCLVLGGSPPLGPQSDAAQADSLEAEPSRRWRMEPGTALQGQFCRSRASEQAVAIAPTIIRTYRSTRAG